MQSFFGGACTDPGGAELNPIVDDEFVKEELEEPTSAGGRKKMSTSEVNETIAQLTEMNEKLQALLNANGIDFADVLAGNPLPRTVQMVDAAKRGVSGKNFETTFQQIFAAQTATTESPTVEIRFEDLTVTAMKLPAESGVSTVGGFVTSFFKPTPKKVACKLLNGISGVLKPGRMTLVLGPPGAGKSTFMKTLANKQKGGNLMMSGKVTYNGEPANTKKFILSKVRAVLDQFKRFEQYSNALQSRRNIAQTVGYVDQVDSHLPTLTVREVALFDRPVYSNRSSERARFALVR